MTGPERRGTVGRIGAALLFDDRGRLHASWRLLLFVLIFLIGLLTLNDVAYALGARTSGPVIYIWWTVLPSLVSVLLASWILMEGVEGVPMAALGLPLDGQGIHEFLLGLLFGGGLMVLIVAVLLASGGLRWDFSSSGLFGELRATVGLSVFYLCAAFAEELLVRGYPLQLLGEWLGGPRAIGVTAVFFAALHLVNPGISWLPLVNIALAGVLLGCLYWRSYSLWIVAGVHFGWNWVMGVGAGLPVSGIGQLGPVQATAAGPLWLTGGDFGPEGSLVATAVLLAAIVWSSRTGRIRRDIRMLALRPLPERHEAPWLLEPSELPAGAAAAEGSRGSRAG